MIELIKRESIKAVNAMNPVTFTVGTVVSASPIQISVNPQLTLSKEFLIITERVTRYEVNVNGALVLVRDGLKVSDRVVLARVQGGNQFVVLDKVVD